MKHRILHSENLAGRFGEYAQRLGVSEVELTEAYRWMLANEVAFEDASRDGGIRNWVSYVDIERRIENPLARRFYAMLRDELAGKTVPLYGLNWTTLRERSLRAWEQWYNILINKIPSHTVRLAWLRLGGAKIGKGSTIWRNTDVLGMESLRIGADSCIGWHCQVDARAGLSIGDHVTVASYCQIIAGGHDTQAAEFWAVAIPIRIDDYAWIGSRAMVLNGAHVGRGAVVAANTVIVRDVQPFKIVGGAGAKPMGERPETLSYKVGGKGLFTLFH